MQSKKMAKDIIKQFEGLRLTAYHCPAGLKTIGYGYVIKPHEQKRLGSIITEKEAERLLEQDVLQAKSALLRNCSIYLTPNQKAALISFIFNCGAAAFQASTLRQKLNLGEYLAASDELLKWVNCKGVKLKGLIKRRTLERAVFLNEINVYLPNNVTQLARNTNNEGFGSQSNIPLLIGITKSLKDLFRKLKAA